MTGETISIQEGGSSRRTGPPQDALPQAHHQDHQRGRWRQAAEGGKGGDHGSSQPGQVFQSFSF